MPCPYAERRGPVIYCKAAGKRVNPLTHPCLSKTRYTKCKYYRKAEEMKAKREEKTIEKTVTKPQTSTTESPREPARPAPLEIQSSKIESTTTIPARIEEPRQITAESANTTGPTKGIKTRGLTLDGKPARNCLECIYYGSRTRMCLLLGVEVKDPFNPPCAKR